MSDTDLRFSAPELLNANALVDADVTMLRILREVATNRECRYITPERLKGSLTRMDVAVVRAVHLSGGNPIVAMGTLSRIETLGRGSGVIQDVVVGNGYIHRRADLVALVVGRLLAQTQALVMETVEVYYPHINLAGEILTAYGYEHTVLSRVHLTEQKRDR